ncbi:hypothetical protein F383_34562 [Gossypium arboreum]|uniref:Uncharacterized protein n=1 Tax=Gossypium arboreum TaxID=29729 RepID=A0A0B0N3W9_GOSAR|nr:hypothetical protein F383_34562 [Gossypium arboreum]
MNVTSEKIQKIDLGSILLGSCLMYCQCNKASPQMDLIDNILVFQSVCSFPIRLRTYLGSSINTSYLSVLRSNHEIPLSIS